MAKPGTYTVRATADVTPDAEPLKAEAKFTIR
jgi:hypothetical protein